MRLVRRPCDRCTAHQIVCGPGEGGSSSAGLLPWAKARTGTMPPIKYSKHSGKSNPRSPSCRAATSPCVSRLHHDTTSLWDIGLQLTLKPLLGGFSARSAGKVLLSSSMMIVQSSESRHVWCKAFCHRDLARTDARYLPSVSRLLGLACAEPMQLMRAAGRWIEQSAGGFASEVSKVRAGSRDQKHRLASSGDGRRTSARTYGTSFIYEVRRTSSNHDPLALWPVVRSPTLGHYHRYFYGFVLAAPLSLDVSAIAYAARCSPWSAVGRGRRWLGRCRSASHLHCCERR
jgi:hypothetical protein